MPNFTDDELATALKVLGEAQYLEDEDAAYVALRRACGKFYKDVKKQRRLAKRAAGRSGRPRRRRHHRDRLADAASTTRPRASRWSRTRRAPPRARCWCARPCYICKQKYTVVDAFYHQLCPDCAALNRSKRDARTDLTGKRALLTGGRAKIGMYIALRLLRDGAHTTITTRFPHDAVRRFTAMPDSADWIHRLRIVGIDLRDPAQVVGLADSVAAQGPLDILINNAAQTVRRTPGAYAPLAEAESAPLPDGPAARAADVRPHQRRPPRGARRLGRRRTPCSPATPTPPRSSRRWR